MIGGNNRARVTEAISSAAKSAGGLVTGALVLSGIALVVAVVALVVAARRG